VKVRVWGSRGSHAAPGPCTAGYGGDTSCVELRTDAGHVVVLDAGTGIKAMGAQLPADAQRVDILLTHLHMDHIQGLGFFAPFHRPGLEVHIWGPGSTRSTLRARLTRYLSPPLFPLLLRDLDCSLTVHDLDAGAFELPGCSVTSDRVCHPSTTMGYRIEADGVAVTYLPDHEPALARAAFPGEPAWISGWSLAHRSDLLIHDAQYTDGEYACRVGWGHSTLDDALAFARVAEVVRFMPFHHDPSHDDAMLDRTFATLGGLPFELVPARDGLELDLSPQPVA